MGEVFWMIEAGIQRMDRLFWPLLIRFFLVLSEQDSLFLQNFLYDFFIDRFPCLGISD